MRNLSKMQRSYALALQSSQRSRPAVLCELCAFARNSLLLLLGVSSAVTVVGDERTRQLAQRLSEEAALFAREAVKVVAEEKLHQKALDDEVKGSSKPGWKEHDVVSQYSFVSFRTAPEALREIRQVQSIDGKKAKGSKSPTAVAAAVNSTDDNQKRKLLEEFQKLGLRGVATDIGQLILLFTGRKIQNYDFSFQSQRFVGTDRTMLFTYSQIEGTGGLTVYRGRDTMRPKLSGEITVDGAYRPLKITLASVVEAADKTVIRQEIEVQYSPSTFPCMLPTRARHREYHGSALEVENEYSYSGFRLWEELRK